MRRAGAGDFEVSDLAVKASEPVALKARLNEDWLSVVIGLLVFALALASVGGTDLLGLGGHHVGLHRSEPGVESVREGLWVARRRRCAAGDLCRSHCRSQRRRRGAWRRRQKVRHWLHGGVCHRLCELDRRRLCLCRGRDPGRTAEIRYRLVPQADQRRWFHRRPAGGACHRELLAPVGRVAQRAIRPELYIKIAIVILGATVAILLPPGGWISPPRFCCAAPRPSSRPI